MGVVIPKRNTTSVKAARFYSTLPLLRSQRSMCERGESEERERGSKWGRRRKRTAGADADGRADADAEWRTDNMQREGGRETRTTSTKPLHPPEVRGGHGNSVARSKIYKWPEWGQNMARNSQI